MTAMWGRPKSSKDEVILSKLVQLAGGDVGLVNEAIRATSDSDGQTDLRAVVNYITQQKERRRAQPFSDGQPARLQA